MVGSFHRLERVKLEGVLPGEALELWIAGIFVDVPECSRVKSAAPPFDVGCDGIVSPVSLSSIARYCSSATLKTLSVRSDIDSFPPQPKTSGRSAKVAIMLFLILYVLLLVPVLSYADFKGQR